MSKRALLGWLSLATVVATIVLGPILVAAASPGDSNQKGAANSNGANGKAPLSVAVLAAKASNALSSLSNSVS